MRCIPPIYLAYISPISRLYQEHDEPELSATEAAHVAELAATDGSDRSLTLTNPNPNQP